MNYTTIVQSAMTERTIFVIDAIMLAKDVSTGMASGGLRGHVTNATAQKVDILRATDNPTSSPDIGIKYHSHR